MSETPLHPLVHAVEEGDCMSSLAERFGHFWSTLWNDPGNRPLETLGRLPGVLMPGDSVTVPAIRPKSVTCPTGARYQFRRKGVPSRLAVQFRSGGKARADAAYRLTIDDEASPDGTLDAEGWLRISVPCQARRAVVTLGDGEDAQTYGISLGRLDPATTAEGIQARLDNLGFGSGGANSKRGEVSSASVRAFQQSATLEVTGTVDDATRERLIALHGS